MSPSLKVRRVRAVGVGVLAVVGAGLTGVAAFATTEPPAPPSSTEVTSSEATSPPLTAAAPTTTSPPTVFVDGDDAATAAESLVIAQLRTVSTITATDPACSRPATGAVGEEFVCYATKEGRLLVSLRVTIGEQRRLTMAVDIDQQPAPVTPETPPPASAPAATTG